MAIKGLTSGAEHEYICRDDPCKTVAEGATAFYWSTISNYLMTKFQDDQSVTKVGFGSQQQEFHQMHSERNRQCFMYGVGACRIGWANFRDEDDVIIPFKTEQVMHGMRTFTIVSEESMDRIPLAIVQEVGNHIYTSQTMTEDARKKFAALSSAFEDMTASIAGNATTQTKDEEVAKPPRSEQTPNPELTEDTGKTPSPSDTKTAAPA